MGICPLNKRVGQRTERELVAVPTGVAMGDARRQLFDAAERVLAGGGPQALTSRSVTTEAGCAKGVLHRHFSDFDSFLAELVLDRIGRIEEQAVELREAAGTETVAVHLTRALMTVFTPVAVAIVGLISSRDGLRLRLRQHSPAGIPILAESAAMIASYLALERALGRVTADADVETLALMLIGTGHMLFSGREGIPPDPNAIERVVTTLLTETSRKRRG